jgi:hypothetical protein
MLTRTLRRGAVDARITCLSHSSRRRLLWAVALPVSPLRISLAPGQCQVASPVEEVWGGRPGRGIRRPLGPRRCG